MLQGLNGIRREGEEVMTDWLVWSPEYGETIPIMDDGSGPMEYGCGVVLVRTDVGKREAIICAVTAWRRGEEPSGYRDDGWVSPFTGVQRPEPVGATHERQRDPHALRIRRIPAHRPNEPYRELRRTLRPASLRLGRGEQSDLGE